MITPIVRIAGDDQVANVTTASIVITASVFTVFRFLADVANITRWMPGDRPVSFSGPTAAHRPGRPHLQRRRVDWETPGYHGRITVYGDSSMTQLQSSLCADRPTGDELNLHIQLLHRIVAEIEDTGPSSSWSPGVGSAADPAVRLLNVVPDEDS